MKSLTRRPWLRRGQAKEGATTDPGWTMTIAETRQAMAAAEQGPEQTRDRGELDQSSNTGVKKDPQSKHSRNRPKTVGAPAETHSTGHKQGRVATFPGRSTADHGWNTADQSRNTADHGRNTADHCRNTADHGGNTADHR